MVGKREGERVDSQTIEREIERDEEMIVETEIERETERESIVEREGETEIETEIDRETILGREKERASDLLALPIAVVSLPLHLLHVNNRLANHLSLGLLHHLADQESERVRDSDHQVIVRVLHVDLLNADRLPLLPLVDPHRLQVRSQCLPLLLRQEDQLPTKPSLALPLLHRLVVLL